ncbi:MAG: bifunctional hydroxymethylpyrimidine kinase/phosphomethylpyrimidine kinase [Phycisphaerales bacterium]|nr:MAG: bifunctional hydroxymethylpyrimidine kinase/phosphomethylpyrimidine kinase [Phycisphaerales bacterium]
MSGRSPKVVVVGGTYVDMAIRCGQIPPAGESETGSALSYRTAGPGPTQAVEAALCGCQVHLISKVGGDPFAQMVRNSLAEFNVSTEFVYTAEAKNTGVVVTLVNATGENASCYYAGANTALLPQDIADAEQVIAEADVCLIHGQLPQEAIVSALRCAELYGVRVILNPVRPLEQRGQGSCDLPIEYFTADILIPNLYEAADIAEQSTANIRAAKLIGSDLVARGVDYAVITMGRRGCMVIDRDSAHHIPAFEIELVDHTGRGDAFAGALAAYCAIENNVRAAAKFASAAGALTCTKFGSLEALPARAEIIELLQKEDTP